MTIDFEERTSDSPFIATVTRGRTLTTATTQRPAEAHWHLVISRYRGETHTLVVGPWKTAGLVSYPEGAEILWVKFRLGTFMPHLPVRDILESERLLPAARPGRFWLHGAAWEEPDFENVETFVGRLARDEVLIRDPAVPDLLRGPSALARELSPRTTRHRFLRATGLSQGHIEQMARAQHAADLLAGGRSILDTVDEAGYYDQPHLTRALKRFLGHTPGELARPAAAAP